MERQADSAARSITQGRAARVAQNSARGGIARSPDGDLDCLRFSGDPPLPARTWLKCLRKGNAVRDPEGELRLTESGELLNADSLVNWALDQHIPTEQMVKTIRSSSTFSGGEAIREQAAQTLLGALREWSLEERRGYREYQRLQAKEDERRRAEAYLEALKAQTKTDREQAWVRGLGEVNERVLETPGRMTYDRGTKAWTLGTYSPLGEVVRLNFTDVDSLVTDMRKWLTGISKDFPDAVAEMSDRLRLDREIVRQTFDEAWQIQKPGLLLAAPGFSKVAIAHGVVGLRFFKRAAEQADKALAMIKADKLTIQQVTEAATGLNEARYLTFQGNHEINRMLRIKDSDDEAGLERLENTSKAGDIATNFLAPGLGFGLTTGKDFAVRAATMHSTGVPFGVGAFAEETVVGLATMQVAGAFAGKDPGFVRNLASNLGTGQAAKAVLAGDAAAFWDVDPIDAVMAVGFAAHGSFTGRRGGAGAAGGDRNSA